MGALEGWRWIFPGQPCANVRCDPFAIRRILLTVSAPSPFAIDVSGSLLAAIRRGDIAAFEQVYRLFERPVHALALRMLADREEAMDITQDTLFKVFERIGGYRGDAPFWGWLRQIAVNECLMRLRRRSPIDSRDELPEPAFDSETDARLPPAAAEGALLERALDALPPTTRSVIWLYHGEGYTHDEIAALMGRSTSFSKSQLARGTQRLRQLLKVDVEDRCHAQ
jgi:RNA polymerase sigma factor (sigma-70 family)